MNDARSNESWRMVSVSPDPPNSTSWRDEFGGADGRAARGVKLVRVVQLNDLHRLVEARGALGELHHEHRAEREVRGHDHPDVGLVGQPRGHPVEPGLGEPRRADDHIDSLVDTPVHVVHHHIGCGEVDNHLGAGIGDIEQPIAVVDHGDEFEVGRGVDRLGDLAAHAPASAQHTDPDRFPLVTHVR